MTAATGVPSRQPARRWTDAAARTSQQPERVHHLSLVVGAVVLLWIGRNQDFYFDDWAFLDVDIEGAINAPHVGHWSAAPVLVFLLFRQIFGLDHYLPFLALALLTHLAVVHLVWRVMRRIGVLPWVATFAALVMLFLGAGAENILWAFQFGFMGAAALALIVVLMLDRPVVTPRGGLTAAILAVVSLTFSGTALPVLFAAGLTSLVRRGFRRSVVLLGPAVVIYAGWYLAFVPSADEPFHGATGGFAEVVAQTTEYAAHMFVDGLGQVIPLPGFGVVVVAVLVLWLLRGLPRWSDPALPALCLVFGAGLFAVLTGYSRAGLGLQAASSSRYLYLITALVLPALAIFASQLIVRRRFRLVPVLVALGVLTCTGLVGLTVDSVRQATLEEQSRGRIAAALADALRQPVGVRNIVHAPADTPVQRWAPDLDGWEIVALYERGHLSQQPYDLQDQLDVAPYFFLTLQPAPTPTACTAATVTAMGVPPQGTRLIHTDAEVSANASFQRDGLDGLVHEMTFEPGWTTVTNTGDFDLVIGAGTGVVLTTCT